MKLVVLSQNGCMPCQMVKNFLQNEEVEFKEVNISNTPDAIEEYGIMSTPVTILIDEGGEEVVRTGGYNPAQLQDLIDQL